MTYIAGDFWRICDRCGFRKRSSETFRTWDGLYVCEEDFETRHPQDLVRGRRDDQNVPDPRPEPVDTIIGPLQTAISVAAVAGASTINVSSSVRFTGTDAIGVMLNDGSNERHAVLSIPTSTSIQLVGTLGGSAAIGNLVINYSAVSEADIG
jgi:hypothetical protein